VKAILNKTRFWFLVGALWMVGAAAWAQPRIAVHPLMVNQEELDKGSGRAVRWNNLLMQEAANQNIAMTSEEEIEAFLKTQGGSCRNNDKCLRDLGYATETYYMLSVQMMGVRDENEAEVSFTINARILRVDGREVKRVGVTQNRVSKTSVAANAVAAYKQLFEKLMLDSLPPQPRGVSLVPPEIEKVMVTRVVPEGHYRVPGYGILNEKQLKVLVSQGMTTTRKASYSLMGVAGVTAGAGAAFSIMAQSKINTYDKKYVQPDTNGRVVRSDEHVDLKEVVDFTKSFNNYKTTYIVLYSVAGAAAITGITLFFISPESYAKASAKASKVQVGLMPTQGGAVLSLQGVFP